MLNIIRDRLWENWTFHKENENIPFTYPKSNFINITINSEIASYSDSNFIVVFLYRSNFEFGYRGHSNYFYN